MILFLQESEYKNVSIDIVITNKTPLLRTLYQEKRLDAFFDNIFYGNSDNIKNKRKGMLCNLYESFVYNPTTKQILGTTLGHYDEVLYASPNGVDEITKEISKTLIRKNPNIIFSRFEDGFGSYTSLFGQVISSNFGKKIYRLFLRFDIDKQENTMYLLEPSFAQNIEGYQLKKISCNCDTIIKKAKQIFQYEPISFPQKYVFFGQGTDDYINNSEMYQKLVTEIINSIGRHEVIVKKHPRSHHDKFGDDINMLPIEYPWELLETEREMENKILISFSSTACITGKLLFNSKSHVIFLYPLPSQDSFRTEICYEEYFEKMVKKYPRVHIVYSMKELIALCKQLC